MRGLLVLLAYMSFLRGIFALAIGLSCPISSAVGQIDCQPTYPDRAPVVVRWAGDGTPKWSCTPAPVGEFAGDAGRTWCLWLTPGEYRLVADLPDGGSWRRIVYGAGPVPKPPVPPVPPTPPLPPKPGKLSIAIVERAGDRPTLTSTQIGQIVGPAVSEYAAACGHTWRVVDADARTWKGETPGYVAYPQKFAADQKLPAVIVGALGSSSPPLFTGPVDAGLLDVLKRFGGDAAPRERGLFAPVAAGDLAPPAGSGAGLLPRDKAEKSRARAFAADFKLLPRSDWAKAKTPRRRPVTIYAQGTTSSCASQAICGAAGYSREIRGLPRVVLSPGSIYPNVNGGRDAGSTLTANVNWLMEHGAAPVEVVPPNLTRKASLPPGTQAAADPFRLVTAVDLDGDFDAAVSALAYGFPVYFGIKWPGGGGHAIYAFDYEVTTVRDKVSADLVIANSWGEDWGDGGCGRLTESQCATMPQFGAFAIVLTTYDP